MKGMFAEVNKLFKEMNKWMKQEGVTLSGAPFLRYHVIDMAGEMDIEVGMPIAGTVTGDERVKPGVLPAGRHASLIYTGSVLQGNKALVEWGRDNGIRWD
jgi:effector-binding domain-containing protein